MNSKLKTTYLKDYRPPDFLVEAIDLHFELGDEKTLVRAITKVNRNKNNEKQESSLVLNGEDLKLISLQLNKKALAPHQYEIASNTLTLFDVPDLFTLEVITEIYPQRNTALSGLYRSNHLFCTQCEAEGFRRITYYLDRPDVMAPFTTTIVADKIRYPVLLSNGNKMEQGHLDENRHFVKWQDPFKKPCYLFALVGGKLEKISDNFITASGRSVALEIFVEPQNKDKCHHAIASLKKAMRWDEEVYGREYDLDVYMIVAVNDFNMGAMENKGLNIFNSKYILADSKTATDIDFQNVEAVIGHEYFHNWTGNRITCRDWFQLSLKEGLTVFREQQFSESTGSATVKRIADANIIRTRQFAEDAGPMAHPVQPEAYIEINNFYTSTVYNKGAEVIRMLHTLLGAAAFRKGMDLYFERHDGEAAIIENFVTAMQDANSVDLSQFYRWYHQAGTPTVTVKEQYDPNIKQFKMILTQSCPQTPGQKEKKPFVIPIKISLYDEKGKTITLQSQDPILQTEQGSFLVLDQESVEFTFENVAIKPVPSLLGNFSAPVKLHYPYTESELALLMISDSDLFNRWDAAQRLGTLAIKSVMKDIKAQKIPTVPSTLIEACQDLLTQEISDPALLAYLLTLPSFHYVAESLDCIEVKILVQARRFLIQTFAEKLESELARMYHSAQETDDGTFSSKSRGNRALKNVCLYYLVRSGAKWLDLAQKQYHQARNMTDRVGALSSVNFSVTNTRDHLFEDFYQQFKHEPLVVNKWLSLQATADIPTVLDNITHLLTHESFDLGNPNKVYALISAFGLNNPERFHDDKGKGYQFLADRILELNTRNPQIAARLLEGLTQWKRLDEKQGNLMKQALERIEKEQNLSEDVYEIVTKSLID